MKNCSEVYCYPFAARLLHKRRGNWHLYLNPVTLKWVKTNNAGNVVIETLKTLRKASASQIAEHISLKTGIDFDKILSQVSPFLALAAENGLLDRGETGHSCLPLIVGTGHH